MKKNELEDRLIDFASVVILFTEGMKNNYAGNHLSGQIIRSSTSPALNYGEAQSAESKKDSSIKWEFVSKNCVKHIIASE